jgi:hypothetical protein
MLSLGTKLGVLHCWPSKVANAISGTNWVPNAVMVISLLKKYAIKSDIIPSVEALFRVPGMKFERKLTVNSTVRYRVLG